MYEIAKCLAFTCMPTDTLYIASNYGAGPAGPPSHIDIAMLLDNDERMGRLGALKRVRMHALMFHM